MDRIPTLAPPRNPFAELREGVQRLAAAVADLNASYERRPELNELQPPSLSPCFAHSLDEWGHFLADALGDLAELESVWGLLTFRGFAVEIGGGGAPFLSAARGGATVWLTAKEGCGLPSLGSWTVGVYPPARPGLDHEALWTLSSNEAGPGAADRMLAAIDAALATAHAIAGGETSRQPFHLELDRLLAIDEARQMAAGEVETETQQRANDIIALLSIGIRQAETRDGPGRGKP